MRLWSLHPSYLDQKGLVALWREGLLAQHVLAGKTKGYRHHPQLHRFLETDRPLAFIGSYLNEVAGEATRRGYRFDATKILELLEEPRTISVTRGQLRYEFDHLLRKLEIRDPSRFGTLSSNKRILHHPSFAAIPGKVQAWEKVIL